MLTLRDDLSPFQGESVLTIGKFDGIHAGHQALVAQIRARADGLGVQSGMVTFDPHPAQLLSPESAPPLLTPLPEKIDLLAALGLDLLVLLTFDRELMQTRAATFLERLVDGLAPRELWVGSDFAMGYKREGNVPFIRDWLAPRGIDLYTMELLEIDGEVISGSRIRARLAEGDVEAAARLLGRSPSLRGAVREGDRRGRTIGFPTANLLPIEGRALPADGVYATRVTLPDGSQVDAVTNVGVRPTVDGLHRLVESHLLDWSGELYGTEIRVDFLHRLREERRFDGLEALTTQIRTDAARARELLGTDSP